MKRIYLGIFLICFYLMLGNPTASMHAIDSNKNVQPHFAEKSVQTDNHGDAWLKFAVSMELSTGYQGPHELIQAFENNQPQPISLAVADFDEDGMPDYCYRLRND